MGNFKVFKLDINEVGKISVIRAEKVGNARETKAALTAKVEEYVDGRTCNVFTCRNNPYVRIVLEGINELPFEEF